MKKVFDKFLIILIICVLVLVSGCKNTTNITNAWLDPSFDYYEYYNGASFCDYLDKVIPMVDEIGEYSKVTFYVNEYVNIFVESRAEKAFYLVVEYDKENYLLEKQKALQNYDFQQDILQDDLEAPNYELPFTERDIGSYTVKVVKDFSSLFAPTGSIITYFPERIGLVAYSDEDMQIRYCYLNDGSKNYFFDAEDMENYIRNSITLGW